MYEDSTAVRNNAKSPIKVWFEPWGFSHDLHPDKEFVIRAVSRQPGEIETLRQSHEVTVWLWPGATIRIYLDDELVEDASTAVPDTPGDMSVREFMRAAKLDEIR